MNPYRGKRALDLLVAGTAGVLFAPVAAAVTIAVWLEDGAAPLFSQPRVGRGREPFTILKFRTLREGNVTHVGQWLRHTGIDELPQFVNVCRGQMSVVGPRPLTPRTWRDSGGLMPLTTGDFLQSRASPACHSCSPGAGHARASGSTGCTCVARVFPSICS